ncbi:single-stranded DNA-binding protein [Sedimentibacter sp. zth1]|uniref:single-stranded DNA-binding protein n=1 Tax=Sedimentibacter sp. zth1 TaxID=2816908 RepID=UPI001A9303BF|nr:single-stranded DNA-binding protein [Sedimentibacter sp. zth1]QSX05448.1 single-stranded DNA-binding protein [Sedimentibacter sp. zth1]
MNNVQLSGRLTKDVDLKYLQDGKAVSKFNLAVDMGLSKTKKKELEKKNKATAEFIPIIAYGKIAENVANYLEKGSQVLINARIHTARYEKDGENRFITQIIAQNVEFIGSKKKDNNTSDDVPSIFESNDGCFLDNPNDEGFTE